MNEIPNSCPPPPTVDARGLNCPLPLLKLKKMLATRPDAARYVLLTTDPDSETDIRRLAAREGYRLQARHEPDGIVRLELTRPERDASA